MFGYISCDLSVPDELEAKFSNFPPFFKNIYVELETILDQKRYWGRTHAEENNLLGQPQQILILGFTLTHGTLILTLSIFTWILDYEVQKFIGLYNTHHFSTVLFSLLLMPGEPVMKVHHLVW